MILTIRTYIIIFLVMLSGTTAAQDARFSQYYNAPVSLNPALAGNGIEHIRVSGLYRTQWAGMGTPFTTQGFAVDKVVNNVGIGGVITRNAAGEGAIRTLNLAGNLAYHFHLGSDKKNTVSLGVQIGVINKSFDETKLTFDNQYNPDLGYDPSLSSGEIYTSTSITRADVNIGAIWQRGWNNKDVRFRPFAGFALFHVTRPPNSFIDSDDRQPVKQSITAGAGYMINERFEIKPSVMLLRQDMFRETTFGTMATYKLDERNTIQAGVYNRVNDAIIAYAGYQMNRVTVGMSYDINNSELSRSGKGTNAFEISLAWSPLPKIGKEPKKKVEQSKPVKVREERAKTTPIDSRSVQVVSIVLPEMILAVREIKTVKDKDVKTVNNPEPNVAEKPVKIKEKSTVSPVVAQQPITSIKPLDSDNDGIPDDIDECPFIKGTTKTNGCPDSDNDGIIDMKDDCPMESGPVTNNGCPDPNVPVVSSQQELVKNFDNILFETGRTKVSTDDLFDIIERAIDIMYADKSTTAILSGHTDFEGDGQLNMELSQARAEVVKAYMIKQGITESRIQTIAYGENMPVGNNLFDDGRKQNRRVEINIVKKK
jgi:type IX secretion system PorP/SprF family membrane protein